jgi:hypothetical protein
LVQEFRSHEDRRKAYVEAYLSSHHQEPPEDLKDKYAAMQASWASIDDALSPIRAQQRLRNGLISSNATFLESDDAGAYACQYLGKTTSVVAQRIGDKNILPYMHVYLSYLFGLAFAPKAFIYVEGTVPWKDIAIFLNTLGRSGVVEARFEDREFPPQQMTGTGQQLPEDFAMRGLNWAQNYFPLDFFRGPIVDEEERNLELPSHATLRAERCLWLGFQLASVSCRPSHQPHSVVPSNLINSPQLNRWMHYDGQSKQFSTTPFAQSLQTDGDW